VFQPKETPESQAGEVQEKVEGEIKDAAKTIREDQLHSIVSGIRGDIAELTAYNRKVGDGWRRKLLEVNYRQYFATTDLLDTIKTGFDKLMPNSDAIVKNTALPDYAKEEFGEISKALMKRELIKRLSPTEFAKDYLKRVGQNASRAIGEFGSSVRDNIQMVGGMAGGMGDDDGMGGELTPEQERVKNMQSAASTAGGLVAGKYLNPQIAKLQKYLKEKGEGNETVSKLGKQLNYLMTTAPERLNDIASGRVEEGGMLRQLFGSILETYNGDDAELGDTTVEALAKPKAWQSRDSVTLNEVIPGWLSKIYSAINGDEAEQYDYTTSSFTKSSDIEEKIRTQVSDNESREFLRKGIDNIVKNITGDRDLSDDAKETLGRVIDDRIRNVSQFNVNDLAENTQAYRGLNGGKGTDELMDLFSDKRNEGESPTSDMNIEVSDEIRRLRDVVKPVQETVDSLAATFGNSSIVNAGIFNKDDDGSLAIDRKLFDTHTNYDVKSPRRNATVKTDPLDKVATVVTELAKLVKEQAANNTLVQTNLPNGNATVQASPIMPSPLVRPTTPMDNGKLATLNEHAAFGNEIQFQAYSDLSDSADFSNEIQYQTYHDLNEKLDFSNELQLEGQGSLADSVATGMRRTLFGDQEPNLITVLKQANPTAVNGTTKDDKLHTLIQQVHEQLTANHLKPEIENIVNMLGFIASKSKGIATVMDVPEDTEEAGYFGKFGQQVTGARKSLFSFLGRTRDTGQKVAGKIRDNFRARFPNPMGYLKSVGEGALSGINSFKDAALGITSIYDADGNVVLNGRKLKEGRYFDAAGNVIKTIQDITGAIYDDAGELIMSEEEVREKSSQFTYYTKQGWQKLSQQVAKHAGGLANRISGIPAPVLAVLNGVGKRIYREAMASGDIYVEGETSPRMTKRLMAKGYYVSKKSGKVILDAFDIDGEVMTTDKEIVITAADLANPKFKLVDVDGKPFKSMLDKIKGRGKAVVDLALKVGAGAKKRIGNAWKGITERLGNAKDYVKSKFSNVDLGIVTKKSSEGIIGKLDDIYKLLSDRLTPQSGIKTDGAEDITAESIAEANVEAEAKADKDKKVFGDEDGDGDRDNGYKDIRQRRDQAKKDAAKNRKEKREGKSKEKESKSGGMFSKLFGGMSGIKGLGSLLGGSVAGAFAKKALSLLGDGIGGIFSKLNPFKGKTVGGVMKSAGRMLVNGAKGLATRVLPQVARTAVMTAARTAATVAVGAIGTISAPVLLAGAAVAGIGYLAYRAITFVKIGPLTKLRMAMYGTEDWDTGKSDEVAKCRYLETEMMKYTVFDKNGVSTVKGVNSKASTAMAEGFGVNVKEPEALQRFEKWLFGRFFPVYLLWTTRAHQNAEGVKLDELSDVTQVEPKDQLKIIQQVSLPVDHPAYQVMVSPFAERGMMDSIGGWFGGDDMMSGEAVKDVEEDILEDAIQLVKDAKKTDQFGNLIYKGATKKKVPLANDQEKVAATGKGGKAVDAAKVKANASLAKDVTTVPKAKGVNADMSIIGMPRPDLLKKRASGEEDTTIRATSPIQSQSRKASDLNALEAIRIKTYGVKDLQVNLVQAIFDLEDDVIKDIKVDGNGASFSGQASDYAAKHMQAFGMNKDNEANAKAWRTWFTLRFIPTLLAQIAALKAFAPNANWLSPVVTKDTDYIVQVANQIIGAKGLYRNDFRSVWELVTSPFANYELGYNRAIVAPNLNYLINMMKVKSVTEETSDKVETASAGGEVKSILRGNKQSTVSGSSADMLKGIDAIFKGPTPMANDSQAPANTSSGVMLPGGGNIPMAGESEFDRGEKIDPTSAYAKLKLKSNGRGDVAKLIKHVASVTGVDANLLLTFAMMESSMNPKAGAGTSSAKGLYQFIDGTWNGVMSKHANKYGIPAGTSAYDPVANALLGAEYIKNGAKYIGSSIPGGKVGPADMYLGHFLGHGGARKFLKQLYKTPDRIAATDWKAAARANKGIFTNRGVPISYREVYEKVQRKARTNFSYVKKYADSPTLAQAPQFPVTKPKQPVSKSSVSSVNTDIAMTTPVTPERKTAVTNQKVTRDVKTALVDSKVNEQVSMVVPPKSAAVTDSLVSDVSSKARPLLDKSAQGRPNLSEYKAKIDTEVSARKATDNTNVESAISQSAKMTDAHSKRSFELMTKQLTVQQQMAIHLKQINEMMTLKMDNSREASQLARTQQRERQKGPEIVHDSGPISVTRQNYTS